MRLSISLIAPLIIGLTLLFISTVWLYQYFDTRWFLDHAIVDGPVPEDSGGLVNRCFLNSEMDTQITSVGEELVLRVSAYNSGQLTGHSTRWIPNPDGSKGGSSMPPGPNTSGDKLQENVRRSTDIAQRKEIIDEVAVTCSASVMARGFIIRPPEQTASTVVPYDQTQLIEQWSLIPKKEGFYQVTVYGGYTKAVSIPVQVRPEFFGIGIEQRKVLAQFVLLIGLTLTGLSAYRFYAGRIRNSNYDGLPS